MHEEDREAVRETFRKMDEERRDGCQWSARFRRLSGDWRYIYAYEIVVARDEAGKRSHMAGIGFDVTEQKRAEEEALQAQEALRKSEEQHRIIMDAVADPIDQITPSGDIIFANKAYLKFYGKSGTERDEIIGANIFDLVPPEHVDIIREKIAGLSPENPIFEHKEEFTNEEGEEFHLFWRDQGLFDEEGNLTGIVAVGRDFTADKKAEAEIKWAQDALRRSEEQYRLVVESQSEMINQFRPDGEIIFLNSNYRNFIERVWGYHKVTTGINLFEVVDENTVLWIKREIDKLKTEEDRWEHEECIRDLDGIEIFVRWEIKALFDDEGRVTSFLSVGRDVTLERNAEEEVREAQEALRKSEEQHRLIMDGIPDMIDQVTPQGEITFSNKSRREFLRDAGVEEGGSVGENIFEQMSPEDAKQLRENFAKFDPEHPILQHEMISVGTDGQEYHLRWRNQALFDDDGKVSSIVGIGRDFTSEKRAEKEIARVQDALRRSEERNRLILDRAFAAVVSMDLEGKITAWNLRAEELFGWPKSEAIGRTVEETIIPRRYREGHREGLKLFRKTGEANVIGRVLELEALHRDGHEFPVDLAITHVELLSGGLFTAFILDISDRKEAEEALRQAKEEAEAATRAKSEFLANMSHEIRTPMNAILGFSELLERKIEDASLKHYLDSISSSGRTLLGLINDLLDLSKIEAGKLNIEWEPVNVTAVFEEIRNIFELRTKEKNLDLFLDIDSALPSWVLLDEVRVRQVLFNLVGNAIKFTHSGHVRLCVEKAYNEVDESKLDLSISVEDTGVGIKAEEQDRIFEEFAQQSGQSSRTFGGTGLGLSITKRLVHLMGGTIEVESEVGKGTTVKVVLKDLEVASVDVDARKTDDEDFEEVIFDPATVLIVEDKYLNRALVREFLENTGLTILEAENGLEGVEAAVRNHPDLILMDISMPVMNGREASKSIRENSEIGSTPIIVLTASSSSREAVMTSELALDGYLLKPVQRSHMINEIKRFLSHRRLTETTAETRPEGSVEESPVSDPLIPIDPARRSSLRNLVERLKGEIMEEYDVCAKRRRVARIRGFAEKIGYLGKEHDVPDLTNLSKELGAVLASLDVAEMARKLAEYPRIVDRIENRIF